MLLCVAAASCITPALLRTRDTGGVYLILAVRAEPGALEQGVSQAQRVIEKRCEYLGVYCQVERQGGAGSDRLKLRVSGANDFERVKAVLLAEGKLELRPVVSASAPAPLTTYPTREAAEKAAGSNYDVVPFEEERAALVFLTVEREPVVTGLDLRSADASSVTGGEHDYQINFTLRPEGAQRFGAWTSANYGHYLAIMLNGKVRSAPYIKGQIFDNGQINGTFTRRQAEDTALTLKSGSLPVHLDVLEEGTYEP
jgi:preprotein translocase subunit SecD